VRASTQAHGPLRLVLSAMAVGILVILLMLFTFVGHQIEVVSPSGTAAAPIKISFEISTSLFEGDGEADVFRDGVLVPLCTGAAGVAAPDPCHETAVEGTGSIIVTVLTSQATSTWNFGEVVVVPPEPTAVPPTAVPPEPKPATYFWLHNGRRIDLLPWW
jgi:hypothetical protein